MPDTIVAQATPTGESALSLVRISGDLSIQIMDTDMYVSFHYNSINNLITLIRIGTY